MREKGATPGPRFGRPHRHFRRIGSTNTVARELAAAGAPHGTVVTAAEQTAGRGRQGRAWTAPPGSALLYSAVLRSLEPRHSVLPLAVALAVCETAEQLRPQVECKVKWPNDVHLDGRKLAGILIEARPQDGWAVIGVGLNLTIAEDEFPEELRDRAISLFAPSSAVPYGAVDAKRNSWRGAVAAEVLSGRLQAWLEAEAGTVLEAWRRRDALLGREVSWDKGSGVADGVDDRGHLLVRLADGDRVALGAGDVHLTGF
ncbi:MAG TPA: biotin--[acetyl-CoA-carboxylase] ligase [Solirubrobacterales bacterium]|jgi:BirA family biotin operon repressor/biotin-[acetyl-CoA-carboxylase] ligase|nr:biotin--[acetyl-CoA-carboxylase] ligase [Solirubrobacterales bacterium]